MEKVNPVARKRAEIMKHPVYLLLVAVLCGMPFGCGDGLVHVGGRVTYSDDGAPLENGNVVFASPTFQASGRIVADGRYVLGSDGTSKGLTPGHYKVYVVGAVREGGKDSQGSTIEIPTVAASFSNPATSGLSIEIDFSTKTFDFQVDRAKKR